MCSLHFPWVSLQKYYVAQLLAIEIKLKIAKKYIHLFKMLFLENGINKKFNKSL